MARTEHSAHYRTVQGQHRLSERAIATLDAAERQGVPVVITGGDFQVVDLNPELSKFSGIILHSTAGVVNEQ